MNKLKKTIKALAVLIQNPWLLNHILKDDSIWKKQVQKTHNIKNGLPVIDLNTLCPDFSETLEYFAFLDGGSLPTDIALLKALSKRFDACQYFEIGTWRGESVSNVADVASSCHTLNLSKEEILSLGLPPKYAELHGFFSKKIENIVHLTGNSLTYDFAALNKKFDLIFIDGNHEYDYVKNDTQKVFEHLVHENTIVVWHDYAFSPEKIRHEVFAGILDGIPNQFKKNLYHVSNTMCAVFIRKNIESKGFVSPITPDKTFRINIKSKNL